jgi:hypothetical protein
MPPPEVLAAAAAVSAAQLAELEEEDEDEADMIGPPPPEIVAEVDLSTADTRTRYRDAKVANRDARGFGWGGRSRGRCATPADFPRHDGTWYRRLRVRRE